MKKLNTNNFIRKIKLMIEEIIKVLIKDKHAMMIISERYGMISENKNTTKFSGIFILISIYNFSSY